MGISVIIDSQIGIIADFIPEYISSLPAGLYSAAQTVSQDNILLRSIRKSVTEQANFLDGIGTAQRNKELESRVLKIAKNLEEEIEEKSGVETSLTENEVVDYVQYVINEIHRK
ncbi:hypothetical protein [Candidatus Nitrosocosmicus sp. T]